MPLLLAAPLIVFMLAFYALPVVTMLMRSVSDPVWTVANYAALPGDVVFLKTFSNTFYTSLIVTLGNAAHGLSGGARRWCARRAGRRVILILILLPFWTSVLVRSYAWMVLMGRHGLINEALTGRRAARAAAAHPQHSARHADRDDPHPAALHDPADRQCAAPDRPLSAAPSSGLGAPPWRTFLQVTLPLSMPGVAAGVLLVFCWRWASTSPRPWSAARARSRSRC